MNDNKSLCCDISDIENPMCWGCSAIWYEQEKEKWPDEEFFQERVDQ